MRTPAWCRHRAAEIGSTTAALVDALLQPISDARPTYRIVNVVVATVFTDA